MRSNWMLCAVLALAATAYAKDPKPYEIGNLQQMDSVQCGVTDTSIPALAGQMVSNDGGEQSLCQEYVLQSERVTYRIRPRNEKDSVLLPVGEPVRFRFQADRIVLRVEDLSGSHLPGKDSRGKDHQYVVVSMSPRSDNSTADATPTRLNHLQ
ncbi:MAG: hypothetical protein ABSE44_18910 [Candidatus Sulfotelmatobacter sp.]|jgi:hypothetical protein